MEQTLSRRHRALVTVGWFALCGCRFAPTQVEVTLDSDAPIERVLTLTASVSRGSEPNASARVFRWTRGAQGISLPASFTVVPAEGQPKDDLVTMVVEATLEPRGVGDTTVRFRRLARWRLQPQVPSRLRLFLPVQCGLRAVGCAMAAPDACTVARLCEEQGRTCGDDGACVAPEVTPTPVTNDASTDRATRDGADTSFDSGVDARNDASIDARNDASFDARNDASIDSGIDASIDSGFDARTDAGFDAVIDAPTGAPFNAPCTSNAQCQSGVCLLDRTGRGVCSAACGGALPPCTAPFRCLASRQCTPDTDCAGAFEWTDPYGDGSLRLSGMQRLGVAVMPSARFTRACLRDTARLEMCGLGGLVELTGPGASAILGRGIGPSIPGPLALTLRASAGPVHALLDNSTGAVTINVDAVNVDVLLRLTGTHELTFIGTNRAQTLFIDSAGPVANNGTLTSMLVILRSAGFTNRGTIMGGTRFGGLSPAAPACP
ncbi:MAG: hypothetical protein Q8Q09_28360 [Deltaproteobacteria bacterium]|nr:hypothetical protein [Deltaproteobacteria bacterium]